MASYEAIKLLINDMLPCHKLKSINFKTIQLAVNLKARMMLFLNAGCTKGAM